MGAVIVQNEMNIQGLGHRLIDPIEELTKLYRPMTTAKFADNSAALNFKRGKQRSGPVTSIVMAASFDLTRPHRKHRLRAVQSLNLRLFVNTQNEGLGGRVEVQSDDIANLLDEKRVLGKFEGFASVGSQSKSPPNASYTGVAQSACFGHRTRTPMGRVLRRRFQGHCQHPLYLRVAQPKWRTHSRFVQQTIEALVDKPSSPLSHCLHGQIEPSRHNRIARSLCTRQNNSRSLCQCLRRLRSTRPSLKSGLFLLRQHESWYRSSSSHRRFLHTSFDVNGLLFIQRTLVPGH